MYIYVYIYIYNYIYSTIHWHIIEIILYACHGRKKKKNAPARASRRCPYNGHPRPAHPSVGTPVTLDKMRSSKTCIAHDLSWFGWFSREIHESSGELIQKKYVLWCEYVVLSFGVSKSKIADGCGWCASCSLLLLVTYEMDRSVVSFAGSLNFDPAFDPGTLFNLIPT